MISFLHDVAAFSFLRHALYAGLLASIACGLVGSYVVVRKIGYIAGAIAHSVLGGMGIAHFFGMNPLGGALAAAIFSALVIGWVSITAEEYEDTIISAVWSIGMAVGIVFIAWTPGYNVDLMTYLFGNILLVTGNDLVLMAALDLIILGLVYCFHRQFVAVCFDEEFTRLRGVRVTWFYLLLLCLVALTVVLLMEVVGIVLVISLLTLPAATTSGFARSITSMMIAGTVLGMVVTSTGIAASYWMDAPSGATIILLAGAFYLLSLPAKRLHLRWRQARDVRRAELPVSAT